MLHEEALFAFFRGPRAQSEAKHGPPKRKPAPESDEDEGEDMNTFDDYAWSGGEEEDNSRYEYDDFVVADVEDVQEKVPRDPASSDEDSGSHTLDEEDLRLIQENSGNIPHARRRMKRIVQYTTSSLEKQAAEDEELFEACDFQAHQTAIVTSSVRRVEAWEVSPRPVHMSVEAGEVEHAIEALHGMYRRMRGASMAALCVLEAKQKQMWSHLAKSAQQHGRSNKTARKHILGVISSARASERKTRLWHARRLLPDAVMVEFINVLKSCALESCAQAGSPSRHRNATNTKRRSQPHRK